VFVEATSHPKWTHAPYVRYVTRPARLGNYGLPRLVVKVEFLYACAPGVVVV
jgi:hypothetical protein